MSRPSVVYPVPLHGTMLPATEPPYMAQLVLPRDLKQHEADRLCAMIQTLVIGVKLIEDLG